MPLSQEEQYEVLMLGREHLASYAVAQYPWFQIAYHHKILFEHLEALERGDYKKLMVFTPPQNGKTSSCSELFPSWCMGRHPWWRAIVVSYAQPRADDFGGRIRYLIDQPYHQAIFPDSRLDPDVQAKDDFQLLPVSGHPMGAVRAAGRKASITGLPADLIVIDDPYSDQLEARSEAVKLEVRKLMNTVIDARMHPETRLLLIMTRWDTDDLAGWELSEHPKGWKVLSLPAIGTWVKDMDAERAAQHEGQLRIPDEMDGNSLWPERYPRDFMLEKRDRLTRDEWLSVYQQTPTKDGDEFVFQDSWFKTISAARLISDNVSD